MWLTGSCIQLTSPLSLFRASNHLTYLRKYPWLEVDVTLPADLNIFLKPKPKPYFFLLAISNARIQTLTLHRCRISAVPRALK